MQWTQHVLLSSSLIFITFFRSTTSRGVSKRLPETEKFNNRVADFVEKVPCEMPAITPQLPTRIRAKIELIWQGVERNDNCWIEMARTRNVLLRLTPSEKAALLRKEGKGCKVPSVVDALPDKFQRKIFDIWERNQEKVKRDTDCLEQQKKTKILLLNLSNRRNKFRSPAFECALPHFFHRLEATLQGKLREIWKGYKRGTDCVEQVDRQIQLLEANDISLKSFQMPPPSMFQRRNSRRKLRRRANVA